MRINAFKNLKFLKKYSGPIAVSVILLFGFWSHILYDFFSIVMAVYFYISTDFLRRYTLIKTPETIKLISASTVALASYTASKGAEIAEIHGRSFLVFFIVAIILLFSFYIYAGSKKLVKEMDDKHKWENKSKVSVRFRSYREKYLKRHSDFLSRFYVSWWGLHHTRSEESMKFFAIADYIVPVGLLYIFLGFFVAMLEVVYDFAYASDRIFGFAWVILLIAFTLLRYDYLADLMETFKKNRVTPIYFTILFFGNLVLLMFLAVIIYVSVRLVIMPTQELMSIGISRLMMWPPISFSWSLIIAYLFYHMHLATKNLIHRTMRGVSVRFSKNTDILLFGSVLCILLQIYFLKPSTIQTLPPNLVLLISFLSVPYSLTILTNHVINRKSGKVALVNASEHLIWLTVITIVFGSTLIIGSTDLIVGLFFLFLTFVTSMIFLRLFMAGLEKLRMPNPKSLFKKLIVPLIGLVLLLILDRREALLQFVPLCLLVLLTLVMSFLIYWTTEIPKIKKEQPHIFDTKFKDTPATWVIFRIIGWYGYFTESELKKYLPRVYKKIGAT
jgi:hypothetical protein